MFAAIRADPRSKSGPPIPQTALAAALSRQIVEVRRRGNKFEPKLNPARIALIKACLIRSPNRKEHHTMTEKLDSESRDSAYLCGQLFAVIGRLQLLALGKVGASIAERTYGGVATRPATTFGPLFTKLPAYLKKANTRFPGSGTNKQKELEALCCRVDALGGIPRTLGLEEQGRFALGYYCQLSQYRTDRAEAEAADKAEQLLDDPT
jgi:CRISPR-associated protein Csd1